VVPTDRVIQFLLMALCVPAGSSSCDSAGHIEAVPAGYDIVPTDHMPDFHHYDDARDIWMAVKARSLELDVRIGHNYGVKAAAAPIYSTFVGASSSSSKPGYSDQQSIVPIVS
nr:hypothetical protein [Tanacetum cinerariifolium]